MNDALRLRLEGTVRGGLRRWNRFGRASFTDRRSGADRLLYVLAGYKPHLWEITLARLERHVPAEIDVCLVTPGKPTPPELSALAERQGWSTLTTAANHVALAQNRAIAAHPDARWIYKLDEDIVVGEGFCEDLQAAYRHVVADGRYRPGFVAPLVNVNGFSYVDFLEFLGLRDAYAARFGAPVRSSSDVPVVSDGAAARWLWERSVPFDALAARFRARPPGYSTVPHRYSIGAILLERPFWEEIGGFLVRPPQGTLGVDEGHLCKQCVDRSRVMCVADGVLAGHVAYGPQDAAMREALPALREGLVPA